MKNNKIQHNKYKNTLKGMCLSKRILILSLAVVKNQQFLKYKQITEIKMKMKFVEILMKI